MLDLDDLKWLADGDKERYMLLEKFFDTPAYTLLMQWAAGNFNECLQGLPRVKNWDEHNLTLGKMMVYERVFKIKDESTNQFLQLAAEAREAAKKKLAGEDEEGEAHVNELLEQANE